MSSKTSRHWRSSDFQKAVVWKPLEPGDIVDFVAPGSACSSAELLGASRFIKSLGLRPRFSRDIFSEKSPLFSASDTTRFQHLKKALQAKDSRLIWCLRGGYGSLRLLPQLTRMARPEQMKLIVGYSDITTLHNFVNFFWRWPSLHGPLLDRFGGGRHTAAEFRWMKKILFGSAAEITYPKLKPLNAAATKARVIKSTIVGGNLAVLVSSLGTPWQMNPDAKILFLEDIGEKAHRVDRMLVQLHQAGYFRRTKAIVLGDFVYPGSKDQRRIWDLALKPFAQELKVPVFRGLPVGHGKVQLPLPFFKPAILDISRQNPRLTVQAGF